MTSAPTRPVDNVVITTKGLKDRNINILAGTTVENKGKLMVKSRGLRWAGHLAWMEEGRRASKMLTGKPKGKRSLGRPRRR